MTLDSGGNFAIHFYLGDPTHQRQLQQMVTSPEDTQREEASSEPPKDAPGEPQRSSWEKKVIRCRFWLRRLIGRFKKKNKVGSCDFEPGSTTGAVVLSPRKAGPKLFKMTNRVSPQPSSQAEPETSSVHPVPTSTRSNCSVPEVPTTSRSSCRVPEVPTSSSSVLQHIIEPNILPRQRLDLVHCGLPNGGNTCYQNSCLQMLRSAEPFIRTLSSQEDIFWNCEEAELMRLIHAIAEAPYNPGHYNMHELLALFRQTVALSAPEFGGYQQQDAHEFLMALMLQIQSLSFILEVFASSLEVTYVCPVKRHIMFKMENIRICRRYVLLTKDFTVLSLDLFPRSSIANLLNHQLMETELEYNCECGGGVSSQTTAFHTLPNFFIVHLKRFTFDSQYRLQKLKYPVQLDRNIVLRSGQESQSFKLVNIISHLGTSANHGHYISDGVDLEDRSSGDGWLTYNDNKVTRSTGNDICCNRMSTAYILMYQRERV
ncbi:hypothetical protein WMY93_005663 [Mugilogobius chulae]|uniref:USP domain-containing protein n=1 Tax=Mugilogobius chulae TaxID=88201 RepID=A0AAW0PWZ2_9GOBI